MTNFSTACVAGALIFGCGRSEEATGPTTSPATPAAPTTFPVSPAASLLSIEGRKVAFPTSALRVTKQDDAVSVLLYTPDSALADDATANTVLVATTVEDTEDAAALAGQTVHLSKPPIDTNADAANAFFLDGGAARLLAADVDVTFSAAGEGWMTLAVRGKFSRLDGNGAERLVDVDGTLWAELEIEASATGR